MARRAKRNKQKKPPRSWRTRLLNWGGAAVVWAIVGLVWLVAFYASDLPSVDKLNTMVRRPSVVLLARDGTEIATYGDLYMEQVPLKDFPPHLIQAVIATEDRRFYDHFGLDPFGLARAMLSNLRAGRLVQGGSTITQQLAKNVFLTPDRTIKRKIQELLLAFWLEANFTKDEILSIYLNRVYLGAGTYGVEAASQRYFNKPVKRLTLQESAMLAGLLKAPSRFAPTANLKRARGRADQVLVNMVDAGYLEPVKAVAARKVPASLAPGRRRGSDFRYFADWVINAVGDYVGATERDLVVITTLDAGLQRVATRTVAARLKREGAKSKAGQAALVALAPDGGVRAMVGGRDYGTSAFNRATQARRQPGSAFKLFVYLAGLEAGLRPGDTYRDQPITVDGWKPRNYSGRHVGQVSLSRAFAESINTVAVQVSEQSGRDRVIAAARRLGISTPLRGHPSIALGTSEVSLVELTGAYASIANGGNGVLPHGILEIHDRGGQVLYRRQPDHLGRVVPAEQVNQLSNMLGGVIAGGTGKQARLKRPAAGKTGTSQDFRDAWFVGYTADLIAGVWVGNDDAGAMRHVTGGGLPARIWRDFMRDGLQGQPARPLLVARDDTAGSIWQRILSVFGGGVSLGGGSPGGDYGSTPSKSQKRKEFP